MGRVELVVCSLDAAVAAGWCEARYTFACPPGRSPEGEFRRWMPYQKMDALWYSWSKRLTWHWKLGMSDCYYYGQMLRMSILARHTRIFWYTRTIRHIWWQKSFWPANQSDNHSRNKSRNTFWRVGKRFHLVLILFFTRPEGLRKNEVNLIVLLKPLKICRMLALFLLEFVLLLKCSISVIVPRR